jgi:hypothetical protein
MFCLVARGDSWGGLGTNNRKMSAPPNESMEVHPGGMPELCDPSGVGWEFLNQRTGGVAALDLRLLSGKPSACTSPRSGLSAAVQLKDVGGD